MITQIKKEIDKNLKKIIYLRKYKIKKKDDSYVSKADLYIQDLVQTYFKNKLKLKNFYLLSEENHENKKISYESYDNLIILDPIDGTENFISGIPMWGISICWYKKNKHFNSLIYLPELKASISKKFKSENRKSRIIGMSSSNNKIIKNYKNLNEIRITGCCVYNIYNVLHGKFKSYSNKKANVWDFIAGFNIALENSISVKVDGKKYNGQILQPLKKYNIEITNK